MSAKVTNLSASPISGAAPLVVAALAQITDAITWRWLKDGVIDQPIEGTTHAFTFDTPGPHQIAIRAQGKDGVVVTSDPLIIQVAAPKALPHISFDVPTKSGTVPFTVVASAVLQDTITWRWLLDGVIDQPVEGLTHTFIIATPGRHEIAIRAQGPGGVVQTDPIIVEGTVPKPEPKPDPTPDPTPTKTPDTLQQIVDFVKRYPVPVGVGLLALIILLIVLL